MANKYINTRIQQKRDTSANWTSRNPILLNGELIIVDTEKGVRFKVGDGTKSYTQLPFTDEQLYNSLSDKVPTTRTINGKALSEDITISESDIGVAAANVFCTAIVTA